MRTLTAALMILAATAEPSPALAQHGHEQAHQAESDTSFASIQSRGKSAMGVDQYTSAHRFDDSPRWRPDRAPARLHRRGRGGGNPGPSQSIAKAFAGGDFDVPGFVHAGEVPGTAVMRDRRSRISYRVHPLPGGGEVRIVTADTAALGAVHEFLAFQRREHRVEGPGDPQ